ncbi:MAG: glycerol-3-phosphate dehydrogenase [Pseudomonadota bacterium]
MAEATTYDIAIIGGGVNGCGIARDAAGRGLSVYLCEKGDIGGATSSWSTKLFHGGLRYLEYYEFRLVREALIEREALLEAMPHISWPLRFVLPHHPGLRPWWLIRLGLFIYDNLGGRKWLKGTENLDLTWHDAGKPLKPGLFKRGYEYSDGWVQDSRLVVLNARDAAARGATIRPRTKATRAERSGDHWTLTTEDVETGDSESVHAKAIVNAGGPWVAEILNNAIGLNTPDKVRLVRGSHIITRRLFAHDKAYIFQNADNRIIFAIPYEGDFTLIGTTDRDHEAGADTVGIADDERDYLIASANAYFAEQITADDIVWTYSGVRPLYDDGASSATAATRDYVLKVEDRGGEPPLLNIFGGKITTYRRLAESALEKLAPYFPKAGDAWTRGVAMPGGDFPHDGRPALIAALKAEYGFLDEGWARRLVTHYGTDARAILGDAASAADLGRVFGHTLTEAEVVWLMDREWARTAEDVVWRRSKLGLRLTVEEVGALDAWMRERRSARPGSADSASPADPAAGQAAE